MSSKWMRVLVGATLLTVVALSQAQSSETTLTGAQPVITGTIASVAAGQVLAQSADRAATPVSAHGAVVAQVGLAMNDGASLSQARLALELQRPSQQSGPAEWILVLIGLLLIVAVSYRRLDSLEG